MAKKIKPAAKGILLILAIGAIFGLKWLFLDSELITKKDVKQTVDVAQVVLPDAPKDAQGSSAAFVPFPSSDLASVSSPKINFKIMAWNSQMGLNYSNGGPRTTKGSLMEKHAVNLSIERQDDCNIMAQELITFAQAYKENPATAVGTNLIAIMGDGAPAWLAGVNNELKKLGNEYTAKIFFSCGKSQGEDQFMAPPSVKSDPMNAKGLVCSTVLRDGDWNIVVKWCGDNGIPVNTDEKTYDPEAMNFVAAESFIDAAQKYISGYSEERDVVKTTIDQKTGKKKTVKTGEKKSVTVNCSSTWTPGDVMIAEKKGGLVRVVSTYEYRSQMPNVVIGIDKWLQDNRKHVENFISAVTEAGDQLKSYPDALNKAGEISAAIYKEQQDNKGNYWVRYYRGVTQTDAVGNTVQLGGSRVHNLADNLALFGIGDGNTNVYASVYKVFGDFVSSIYPEYVKTYPEITEVLDKSYLVNVKEKSGNNLLSADKVTFDNSSTIENVVAKKNYKIEFAVGSAEFTREAEKVMEDLYDQLTVANALRLEIYGHTDNTGNPGANESLSEQRALAVKRWLQRKAPSEFPENRFVEVKGKGQNEPLPGVDANSQNGRAKNRRVEIKMG